MPQVEHLAHSSSRRSSWPEARSPSRRARRPATGSGGRSINSPERLHPTRSWVSSRSRATRRAPRTDCAIGTRSRSTPADARSHPARGRRRPGVRRAAWARPREPGDRDRPYRGARRGERHRGSIRDLQRVAAWAPRAPSWRRRLRRPRTTRWLPCFRRSAAPSIGHSPTTWRDSSNSQSKSDGIAARPACRRRHTRATRRRWIGPSRTADGRRGTFPATSRDLAAGSGQPAAGRARRVLGRVRAVRAAVGSAVPRAASAGDDQPRIHERRTTRSSVSAVTAVTTDGTHRRSDDSRNLLGLRRHAESLCAPPRLYNQIAMADRRSNGHDRDVVELARLLALVKWRWPTPASPSGSRSITTRCGGR